MAAGPGAPAKESKCGRQTGGQGSPIPLQSSSDDPVVATVATLETSALVLDKWLGNCLKWI